jgi:hypothetical protein
MRRGQTAHMPNSLLLALLLLSLAGFACAAAWSRAQAAHARRWDAAFAFVIGAAAAELVLLASPLALMFPWLAAAGLVLPMLAGPFWWRSRHGRVHWSWRRWALQLAPGMALLVSALLTLAGTDLRAWSATDLPSVALVIAAALLNLAVGAVRAPRRGSLSFSWR